MSVGHTEAMIGCAAEATAPTNLSTRVAAGQDAAPLTHEIAPLLAGIFAGDRAPERERGA